MWRIPEDVRRQRRFDIRTKSIHFTVEMITALMCATCNTAQPIANDECRRKKREIHIRGHKKYIKILLIQWSASAIYRRRYRHQFNICITLRRTEHELRNDDNGNGAVYTGLQTSGSIPRWRQKKSFSDTACVGKMKLNEFDYFSGTQRLRGVWTRSSP